MTNYAGWYIGRIESGSVAIYKGGTSLEIQDTVFQWKTASAKPTVATANITSLTAIVGGPYATQAAAEAAAGKDPNTTSGLPGTNKPGVGQSTVNSSNGKGLPNPLGSIGGFIANLETPTIWLRIAEGILGIVLIAVGLAHATHAVPIATKIAAAVA